MSTSEFLNISKTCEESCVRDLVGLWVIQERVICVRGTINILTNFRAENIIDKEPFMNQAVPKKPQNKFEKNQANGL